MAYRGAAGYEAPEVVSGLPHSLTSDAYIIGRALLNAMQGHEYGHVENNCKGKLEAKQLSMEATSDRLTVDHALHLLKHEE
jgi:hypothetical protein